MESHRTRKREENQRWVTIDSPKYSGKGCPVREWAPSYRGM